MHIVECPTKAKRADLWVRLSIQVEHWKGKQIHPKTLNFSLSNPILLKGVRIGDVIGDITRGEVMGNGTSCKFWSTITLEELDCDGEKVFSCSFELFKVT